MLYEYGEHFDKVPQNGDEIVSNLDAVVINSMPNSSFIINPYVNLTLTQLKSQTKYFVYMTAYNSLGVSTNVTTVVFETSVPSNAVRFALTLRN